MRQVIAGAVIAAISAFGGVASAAGVCTIQNGYKMDSGTYKAVVDAGHDAFKSNRKVANCEVKEVLTALKGKPEQTTVFFGPMTQDECSLYKSLSSINSKLEQGKLSDAYSVNAQMIAKVGSIQIDPAAAASITGAANETATCISDAMK